MMRELEKEPLHGGPQLSGVFATAEGRWETSGIRQQDQHFTVGRLRAEYCMLCFMYFI